MACDCKANRDIIAITKKYGAKQSETNRRSLGEDIRLFMKYIGYTILGLLCVPFMVIYLLYKAIFAKDHGIHINKIFRLSDGRKQ